MSTNFPTSLDTSTTIPAEGASTPLATNHVTAHQNIQDAIEAIEAKVGADSSIVTTSHDYKLSEVTSTDKAVGKTASQTLTNKTLGSGTAISLGSDAEGDTYYRNSSGVLVRLARGTDNYILKMNGNVPNWEAESVTSNASTTTAGIVELATASEINSGTATGGSGAPLVITPDNFASSVYANAVQVLSKSYSNTTVSNTVSETTLFSYTIAGGTLGTSKAIRIKGSFAMSFNATGAGNNLTLRLKLGGTTLDTNTITPTVAMGTTSTDVGTFEIMLYATGATNTQEWMYNFFQANQTAGTVSDVFHARKKGTASADSTIDRDLVITAQYAAASTVNAIQIENYVIEYIP